MEQYLIRLIDLDDGGEMLKLLALQMAAYVKEAEMIGLPDIPPLFESPETVRGTGEVFFGCYNASGSGDFPGQDDGREAELVGAISIREEATSTMICRLMVCPNRFRQGVASQLIRFVLGREMGREVKVRTVTANAAALTLYASFGFYPDWEEPTVLGLTLVELSHVPDIAARLKYHDSPIF